MSRTDTLSRLVHGALKSCIDDHGPITHKTRTSAAKRIVSQVKGALANDPDGKLANEHLHARIKKLQYANKRLTGQVERLRQRTSFEGHSCNGPGCPWCSPGTGVAIAGPVFEDLVRDGSG